MPAALFRLKAEATEATRQKFTGLGDRKIPTHASFFAHPPTPGVNVRPMSGSKPRALHRHFDCTIGFP